MHYCSASFITHVTQYNYRRDISKGSRHIFGHAVSTYNVICNIIIKYRNIKYYIILFFIFMLQNIVCFQKHKPSIQYHVAI